MHWHRIVQVSLLNLAVALMILPLDSVLNRVMISELQLSATLVALLISLRFITSPLRIVFGRMSDANPIAGRKRTWYILIGIALMAIGLILSPHAALAIPRSGFWGGMAAFLVFGILGLGVNMTTPLYFALVSDRSDERHRPRIMATMFIILGIGIVIASFAMGQALEPYSEARLFNVFYAVAGFATAAAIIGLVHLEAKQAPRPLTSHAADAPEASSSAGSIRALLLRNREALRFFAYLVLTFVAVEAQEVILEPYAAEVFGMPPGDTTRLTGIFRIGSLIMLAVGAMMVRRRGIKFSGMGGVILAVLGLLLILIGGIQRVTEPFLGGVLIFGLGSGALTITNLSMMINMTDENNAGVFQGAWGFAQAVGVGGGTLAGGIIRDIGLAIFGTQTSGYATVFLAEIGLLALAVPLLLRFSLRRFQALNREVRTPGIL
jgi:BCD family chlorophyll transporter-like MFS transporter